MPAFGFIGLRLLVVILVAGGSAISQSTSKDSSKPAPNAWMLIPTPYLDWNKGIAPSVRAERDKDADEGAAGQELPLTAPHPDALGPGHGGAFRGLTFAPTPTGLF